MATANARDVREVAVPTTTTRPSREQRTMQAAAGGSAGAALVGICAIVLAIIGLAGILPIWLAAGAAIALGVGLLIQAASLAMHFTSIESDTTGDSVTTVEMGGGASAALFGGLAAIILGILTLVGLVPYILAPIVAIVLGATFMAASTGHLGLGQLSPMACDMGSRERIGMTLARGAASGSGMAQAMAGLASIVLGIVGVVATSFATVTTLSLVAFLVLGAAALLAGCSSGWNQMYALRRR